MDDEAKSMQADVKIKGIDYNIGLTLVGDNEEQLLVELRELASGSIWKSLFEASCNFYSTMEIFSSKLDS